MNNEMKFEKNGLLIPNGALEELGLVASPCLHGWDRTTFCSCRRK